MNLPFDAWLIVLGLAVGAGLAWLVLADLRRHEDDLAESEVHSEAAWIADTLRGQGLAADAEAVEEVLRLHRSYLVGIPDEAAWSPPAPQPDHDDIPDAEILEDGSPADEDIPDDPPARSAAPTPVTRSDLVAAPDAGSTAAADGDAPPHDR